MKRRLFKIGDIIQHFKRELEPNKYLYIVIGYGKNTETLEDFAVYRSLNSSETWIRPLRDFMSKIDKVKYPDIKQEYKFEHIHCNKG